MGFGPPGLEGRLGVLGLPGWASPHHTDFVVHMEELLDSCRSSISVNQLDFNVRSLVIYAIIPLILHNHVVHALQDICYHVTFNIGH